VTAAYRFAIVLAIVVSAALPIAAQDLPVSIRTSAACAPVPSAVPSDAPRVVGGQDPAPRTLYGARDPVVVNAGTARGVQIGQKYFVRRAMKDIGGSGPRAEVTAGWLSIVSANDYSAIAMIDFACGGVVSGDHLEPYVEPVLPPDIDRTDASGALDFSTPARVMYGDDGRNTGGVGDFMIADTGQNQGALPGARYAVYRDLQVAGVPAVAIGEAIVVSTVADSALIRLTQTRDAVRTGDLLVPRQKPQSAASPANQGSAAPAPEQATISVGEGNTPQTDAGREETIEPVRSYTFEDVYFDFDRYTPRSEALRTLDEVVTALEQRPTLHLQIEGHTCNVGTAEYNLALGERRAKAVRDYLISRGVPSSRLTTISYGEERPKHGNSREARRQNRRAALVVNLQE
jgi:peptidoglycan-associated lipoprotein